MVHFTQSCPAMLFDSHARYTARAVWVTPFGRPGIIARLPLPRAFRGLPRPSSPRRPKASAYGPSIRLAILPLSGPLTHGGCARQAAARPLARRPVSLLHVVQPFRAVLTGMPLRDIPRHDPQRNHAVLIVSIPRYVKKQQKTNCSFVLQMGQNRVELLTPALSERCSNQLSYCPRTP